MNPENGDLYGGLSGVTFEVDRLQLNGGVTISTTFAHLMCPLILAFSPAPQGQAHPGPWKEAEGGSGFDLSAEIFVPKEFNWPNWFDRANTIWWGWPLCCVLGQTLDWAYLFFQTSPILLANLRPYVFETV